MRRVEGMCIRESYGAFYEAKDFFFRSDVANVINAFIGEWHDNCQGNSLSYYF